MSAVLLTDFVRTWPARSLQDGVRWWRQRRAAGAVCRLEVLDHHGGAFQVVGRLTWSPAVGRAEVETLPDYDGNLDPLMIVTLVK